MKTIICLLTTVILIIAVSLSIAYHNAMSVGITQDQFVAWWKLQFLWAGGIAAAILAASLLGAGYQFRRERKKKSKLVSPT